MTDPPPDGRGVEGTIAYPRFGPRPSIREALTRHERWERAYRRLRLFFFVDLGLVLGLVALIAMRSARDRSDTGEWLFQGTVAEDDLAFDDGSGNFDSWLCSLGPDQLLRVEMSAEEFSPFLYVVGPRTDPAVAATSEGGDLGMTARLEFRAAREGEYEVVVPAPDTGLPAKYRLSSNHPLEPLGPQKETSVVDAALGAMILLLCLPLLVWTTGLPTRLLWRNPDRILLLRPFEERGVSFSLKRFTKQNLAFRGFTLTLADKHLRHSLSLFLLAHLPLDLGDLLVTLYRPLFRRIHRYLFIRKSSDLRLLRFRLRLRYRLGSNWQSWLGLSDRITKIRSHNDLWRDCIDILMDNCQVIVVDVSDAGEGTLWEIEEVFRRQYLYKTLFIVRDGGQQAAANLLARIAADAGSVGSHALAPALHPYSSEEGALIRKGAFALEYAAAVSSARQPRVQPLPISRKAVFSLAPTLVIGPFWSPFGIVLAVSALREIDRSKGMIPGEYLAHLAILIHLVLFVGFLVAVFLPSLVS